MSAISLPERGQPLDVNYVYDMASQINNLTNAITVRSSSSSKINENFETTSNLKIFAATKTLTSATVKANDTEVFFFTYPEFKFVPVATVTVVNNSGSSTGESISTTLKSVLTSRSEGVVKFNAAGAVNLSINIIVIGIAP